MKINLDELKTEYSNQDNRATSYPIWVSVQEQVCIGVMVDGYSVNCPYGDGEIKTEYRHEDYENAFENKEELVASLKEDYAGDYEEEPDVTGMILGDIEEITVGYIWHSVEFFLTIRGAEEYIKANSHNHGKLRTYVHHIERRNFEMRGLLETLEFCVGRENET